MMNNLKSLYLKNQNYKNCYYLATRRSIKTSCILLEKIENRKRICIVGAGPAGFYAAQYLLKQLSDCTVDIVEKLPVPFGLVRFGVAPDHPEVKNVINTFTKTAENSRCNFYGNLELGKDLSLKDLRESYHAVLLTYGADQDRQLNIPNEEKANVLSARKFVAWYNGLPGAEQLKPKLDCEAVTIVGQGNVAIDVARMLLSPLDLLMKTDTTDYALQTLSESRVRKVYLIGRRGPLQAAFTIKELREMLKLPQVQTIWRPKDFEDVADHISSLGRPRKRLTELMLKSLNEQNSSIKSDAKQFFPVFLRAPKAIIGKEIEFYVTKLENEVAIPTKETEKFPADLVLRSIGYKSSCADNEISFDNRKGCVNNEHGRVYQNDESKTLVKGLYVAGWLGTGPTGVILTTMNGAFSVAKTICDDILSNKLDTSKSKPGLDLKNKRPVTWDGWERIDKAETEAGGQKGKPREKIVNLEEMLKIADV